uniref:(northern house mosquito) hypothetical protein n=1 Tax=Culex pipiens TaxID=7175 RepID=A0A8D8BYD0_CULPI
MRSWYSDWLSWKARDRLPLEEFLRDMILPAEEFLANSGTKFVRRLTNPKISREVRSTKSSSDSSESRWITKSTERNIRSKLVTSWPTCSLLDRSHWKSCTESVVASGTHPRSVTRVTRQLRTDVSCSHRARASGEGDPAKIRTERLWSVDSALDMLVVFG